MPVYLKSLVVILGLATLVFAFASKQASVAAMDITDFKRRRNLWICITLVAFLSRDFWIYILVTAVIVLSTLPREKNKLAMYFFVLFAVPPIPAKISGFGMINFLFDIDYVRLLALIILLPTFLGMVAQSKRNRFGQTLPDKFILGYLSVILMLMIARGMPLTNTIRHGIFYSFTDVFLPYYVASRYPKSTEAIRDALMSFAIAMSVLSGIAVFESMKGWLLYNTLDAELGQPWGFGKYMVRGESIRAVGSTGHGIVLGYLLTIGIGFFIYLKKTAPGRLWGLGFAMLVIGLIVTMSRGPWVGALAMLMTFIITSPNPVKLFLRIGAISALIVPLLLITPYGKKVIDSLPFVGTIHANTVTYRQDLFDVSLQVIMNNPVFGVANILDRPEMQQMRQGEGIIDLVNTYIEIALSMGLVGLFFFAGAFLSILGSVFARMRSIADKTSEDYKLGQALFAVLIGVLVTIATVSSINVIPVVYWSVAGLAAAYLRMQSTSSSFVPSPIARKTGRIRPAQIRRVTK